MALRAMVASPAFAVSAVLAVASRGASVAAVRASVPTAEVAAVVCAGCPVACGHWRRAAAVVAAADVSARCAAAPRFAAGGADRALAGASRPSRNWRRSEEHTSELQSPCNLVCRLLLEKK